MEFCITSKEDNETLLIKEKIKNELIKAGLNYNSEAPELVISIGGDGTFLQAVSKYFKIKPIFASINYGNLGYLCEYKSSELKDFISDLSSLNHLERKIHLLEIKYNGKKKYALNEVRVESNDGHTLVFDVYVNGTYLETLKSDGCCASTSIGSSGMCRSLGGAIVDNEIELIEFVENAPILNRTYVSIRSPFVFAKDKVITIKNIKNKNFSIYYDCISDSIDELKGDIEVKLSNKYIRVFKNPRNNYIRKTHEAFINE